MRYFINIAFIIIFLVFVKQGRSQTANLLNNGGFEEGTSSWAGWSNNINLSQNAPFQGEQCALFTASGNLEQLVYNLEPGKTYKLSAAIKINSMVGNDWGGIRFSAISSDWSEWSNSDFYSLQNRPSETWFNELITFTATTSSYRIQLGFFGGQAWTYTFSFDAILLAEELPVNAPPVIESINLTATSGNAPLTISGNILASDSDGIIHHYIVDMGEGSMFYGQANFTYTYHIPGIYPLKIRVVDDQGAFDTASAQIEVTGNNNHKAVITAPAAGGSVYQTTASTVDVSGIISGGSGQVFWVNNRTAQSGFADVVNNGFNIDEIELDYGINLIQVQSFSIAGENRLDAINVEMIPLAYAGPEITDIQYPQQGIKAYERFDIPFNLKTIADNLFFPYDTAMPENLSSGQGITVDLQCSNGLQTLLQPAFYNMEYERIENLLLPSGNYSWNIRMAIKEAGNWQCRINATDAGGETYSQFFSIQISEDSSAKGYINPSTNDNRYFSFDNGEEFLPMGYGTGVKNPDEIDQELAIWQANKLNFGRFWLSSKSPFLDSWSSWATHHTMENNGYMPPPLLSASQRFMNGAFSFRIASPAIENVQTPAIFRGFWDGQIVVKPATNYRLSARVKTMNITGNGGLVIKTGGWLGTDVVNPGTGTIVSTYLKGNNPWSYLLGNITTNANQTKLDYIYLVMENCTGEAYLDQLLLQEILPDGSLGQNILSKWNANSHLYLDPIKPKEADYMIDLANESGIYYKTVILEKDDYIANSLDAFGYVNPDNGSFDANPESLLDRLYNYYWRHLIARFGYAQSIHSWELVNEAAPGANAALLDRMATFFKEKSPYPRMSSTSFWSEWMPEFWEASKADYADVHAYIMTTGWINQIEIDGIQYNREDLKNDAAAAVYAYAVTIGEDSLRNKPVIIGETELDMAGSQEPDPMLALDTAGVWLHNFVWAHINHSGVSALLWNSDNINEHDLHWHFKGFMNFMEGIQLSRKNYINTNAQTNNPMLRVWGQKQADGNATHFWVQNRSHTWKQVLEQGPGAEQNGFISISDLSPGDWIVQRWDTWSDTESPTDIDTLSVGANGVLSIEISNLQKDLAFKAWALSPPEPPIISENWTQFQHDAGRSGHTHVNVAPPYRARWIWAGPNVTLRNQLSEPGWTDDLSSRDGYSFPIPDTVDFTISGSMQAVVLNDKLFFATMEGDCYALSVFDGSTIWHANLDNACIIGPAILGDHVVFSDVNGYVKAFSTENGSTKWAYNTRAAISSAAVVSQNQISFANHHGKVFNFSENGQLNWQTTLPAPVVGGMAAGNGLLYVPAENMVVYAINLNDGSIHAQQQLKGQSFRLTHPVLHQNKLYVTSAAIPMTGSEYIMEEVMAASSSLAEEETNIRRWLQGDDNNGTWPYASTDWQHFFVLDAITLSNQFLVAAGPVDGVGYPAPSPVVDRHGRVLRWWKTRFAYLTAPGPAFGTNYTLDIAGVDPFTGNRVPIDNGQFSNMWPIETDNLYGLSIGGDHLWMRQNFRGTQVINIETSQHTLAQVTTRINDGGDFSHAHICYRQTNLNNGYLDVPYIITQQRSSGRTPPVIAQNLVFLTEEFAIVAIENYAP